MASDRPRECSVQVKGAGPASPGSRADLAERLRDMQSITDASLSRLDDHELLTELLERTRFILQADTAAVLLLDYASGHLIATAAVGLEEEVRQGVRIPVGRGFAGRIAADHRPVILDRVDHSTVLNPILLAKGIRALMGVPLIPSALPLGVSADMGVRYLIRVKSWRAWTTRCSTSNPASWPPCSAQCSSLVWTGRACVRPGTSRRSLPLQA